MRISVQLYFCLSIHREGLYNILALTNSYKFFFSSIARAVYTIFLDIDKQKESNFFSLLFNCTICFENSSAIRRLNRLKLLTRTSFSLAIARMIGFIAIRCLQQHNNIKLFAKKLKLKNRTRSKMQNVVKPKRTDNMQHRCCSHIRSSN
jgi:hypothetical protein